MLPLEGRFGLISHECVCFIKTNCIFFCFPGTLKARKKKQFHPSPLHRFLWFWSKLWMQACEWVSVSERPLLRCRPEEMKTRCSGQIRVSFGRQVRVFMWALNSGQSVVFLTFAPPGIGFLQSFHLDSKQTFLVELKDDSSSSAAVSRIVGVWRQSRKAESRLHKVKHPMSYWSTGSMCRPTSRGPGIQPWGTPHHMETQADYHHGNSVAPLPL